MLHLLWINSYGKASREVEPGDTLVIRHCGWWQTAHFQEVASENSVHVILEETDESVIVPVTLINNVMIRG